MAKDKRKATAQDAGPTQPRWRRAPARSRKELRKMQSATKLASKRTDKSVAITQAPGRWNLRLPSRTTVRDSIHRVVLLVIAVGFTFGMIQLLRLPQMAVSATSTQIGGVQRITREKIYNASGIEGRNIFLVRPNDVAAAVSQVGGIAAVQVHVRLPNQVLIDVQEHAPLVAWQGVTTTLWLAADGALVPQAGQAPPLTLVDQTEAMPDAESLHAPLLLKNLIALHDTRPDIAKVYYRKNQGLSFQTPEGSDVWLGDSGPMADKLAVLEVARREITRLGKQAKVIDLRHNYQRAIWW